MCECCLGARCVVSWSSHSLKRGIPWQFFGFFLFLFFLCASVHANHKHVQSLNPTTTTSFWVIHNNNNKHGDKPKQNEVKEVVVVEF